MHNKENKIIIEIPSMTVQYVFKWNSFSFIFSVVLLDSSKFPNLKNWTTHINGQSDSNTGVSSSLQLILENCEKCGQM